MKTLMALAILAIPAAAQEDFPKVAAADAKALEKLNQAGAVAIPLAANTNVVSVNFSMAGAKVNDAALEDLKPLAEQLVWLNLAGTAVTDAGLKTLAGFKNLQRLHLERTAVSDDGLGPVAGLGELRYLNLYGTKVTDKGLGALKALKKLQSLYVWQTAVTEEGAKGLNAALATLKINRGVEEPAKPVEEKKDEKKAEAGKPINAKCPVSGKDVDPAAVSVYKGQTIGFCCMNCKAKFDAKPEDLIGKVPEFKAPKEEPKKEEKKDAKPAEKKDEKKADAGKPINGKCPLSGKDVDAAATSVYKAQTIGFCCMNCKAKFDKEPEKFIAKVAEFKAPK
jgi:YHS domain-containing protein